MDTRTAAEALEDKKYLSSEVIEATVASDGLEGKSKKLGVEESLEVLGRKNDVWASFQEWYDGLDSDAQNYMDFVLEAALVGLENPEFTGTALYDAEAMRILTEENARELTDPEAVGPVSTAITRTIIKRTIKKNCATKWAGC
ncbi:hypothetical protein [Nocardiopsis rhodophaea]|uniref:hypothetical protein n=1 Tax=Nocardiopsis rhodophaea TaxID=280238 RepID=UPI0031D9C90E